MISNIALLEQYFKLYQGAISQNEDQKELVSDLLSIFRNYSLWEQQLRDLAEAHAPLHQLLRKSAEIVHNPIAIFDLEGNLLGASNLEKAAHVPTFAYVMQHGKMSATTLTVRYVDRSGRHHPDLSEIPQLTHPENNTESECLSMYLVMDGERVGYCMFIILDEQELELDYQFITFLKHYFLEAEEFTSVVSPARSNRTIIMDLIAGKGISEEAADKFLRGTGIRPPFQLLEIHSNGIVNYTQRSMLIRDVGSLRIPLFVMDYDTNVLILAQESSTKMLLGRISDTISTRSSHLTIGISMPFSQLETLTAAHHQALFALQESQGKDGIFFCRDVAFSYLVRTLAENEMTAELLHPAVDILSNHDVRNESELLKTLDVYLQQGMNQISTAQELYIHRNTLKYRLKKIEELTHIDFDDPEEKLYLSLSLKLARFDPVKE